MSARRVACHGLHLSPYYTRFRPCTYIVLLPLMPTRHSRTTAECWWNQCLKIFIFRWRVLLLGRLRQNWRISGMEKPQVNVHHLCVSQKWWLGCSILQLINWAIFQTPNDYCRCLFGHSAWICGDTKCPGRLRTPRGTYKMKTISIE